MAESFMAMFQRKYEVRLKGSDTSKKRKDIESSTTSSSKGENPPKRILSFPRPLVSFTSGSRPTAPQQHTSALSTTALPAATTTALPAATATTLPAATATALKPATQVVRPAKKRFIGDINIPKQVESFVRDRLQHPSPVPSGSGGGRRMKNRIVLHLKGPSGSGKTTLLEEMAHGSGWNLRVIGEWEMSEMENPVLELLSIMTLADLDPSRKVVVVLDGLDGWSKDHVDSAIKVATRIAEGRTNLLGGGGGAKKGKKRSSGKTVLSGAEIVRSERLQTVCHPIILVTGVDYFKQLKSLNDIVRTTVTLPPVSTSNMISVMTSRFPKMDAGLRRGLGRLAVEANGDMRWFLTSVRTWGFASIRRENFYVLGTDAVALGYFDLVRYVLGFPRISSREGVQQTFIARTKSVVPRQLTATGPEEDMLKSLALDTVREISTQRTACTKKTPSIDQKDTHRHRIRELVLSDSVLTPAIFENYPRYMGSWEAAMEVSECFSLADTLVYSSWRHQENLLDTIELLRKRSLILSSVSSISTITSCYRLNKVSGPTKDGSSMLERNMEILQTARNATNGGLSTRDVRDALSLGIPGETILDVGSTHCKLLDPTLPGKLDGNFTLQMTTIT